MARERIMACRTDISTSAAVVDDSLHTQDAPKNRRSAAPISSRAPAAERITSTDDTEVWIARDMEGARVDTRCRQGPAYAALVSERVNSHVTERWRQARQIARSERRCLGCCRSPDRHSGPKPTHQRGGEHCTVGVGDVRLAREIAVGHGVHQHLAAIRGRRHRVPSGRRRRRCSTGTHPQTATLPARTQRSALAAIQRPRRTVVDRRGNRASGAWR